MTWQQDVHVLYNVFAENTVLILKINCYSYELTSALYNQ